MIIKRSIIVKWLLLSCLLLNWGAKAEPLTFNLTRLVDEQLVTVSETDFANQYLLIAIGFTGCPDICPTTLLDMKNLLAELDEKNPDVVKQLQPLFVTIDPNKDSLADLNRYTNYFDARIIGLKAPDWQQLDDFVGQLRGSYGYQVDGNAVFPPDLPDNYTVYHSTYVYLYAPDRTLIEVFGYNLGGVELANRIRTAIKNHASK